MATTPVDEDIIDVLYRCRSEGKNLTGLDNNFFKEQHHQRQFVRGEFARQSRDKICKKLQQAAAPARYFGRDSQLYRSVSNALPRSPSSSSLATGETVGG